MKMEFPKFTLMYVNGGIHETKKACQHLIAHSIQINFGWKMLVS